MTTRYIITREELQRLVPKGFIVPEKANPNLEEVPLDVISFTVNTVLSRPADDIPDKQNYTFATTLDWIHRAKTAEKLVRELRGDRE